MTCGRAAIALLAAVVCAVPAGARQRVEKELVATITGPDIERAVVAGLAWDGTRIVIQNAVMEPSGVLKPKYLMAPGPGMKLQTLIAAPASLERYWAMKSNRRSPTGLGRITTRADAKLPMYGVGSLQTRVLDAVEMGGTQVLHELKLHDLTIHVRKSSVPPYDGEVWSWSPPELNRIAYVDGKGDVWIAGADGRGEEKVLAGTFTLPAWSDDGRYLAVAERKDNGRRWDVSVIHLPEKFRK